MDVCTSVDDALCLAALAQCTLRMLYRLRSKNQRWRIYPRLLVSENRWRAMRYSFDQGLIDLGKGRIMPFPQLMEELLDLVHDHAVALGCVDDIQHAHKILARGTSAHRQVGVYEKALEEGATPEDATRAVVDHLIDETARGI